MSDKQNETTDEAFKRGFDEANNQYHPVMKSDDGTQLYAKEQVQMCQCDGSLHKYGMGCD